jgi:hypothetical protein
MAATPRHYNGFISRFSAGAKASLVLPPDLAASLKQIEGAGPRLHVCGVNLSAGQMQNLIGLLRHGAVEVILDRIVSAPGDALLIFTGTALAPNAIVAVAAVANQTPAGRRIIDCEGYSYLTDN